jgi:RNA polymerase sigma factor (sigma-70 family)
MATSPLDKVVQHLRRAVLLRDGAGLTDAQLLGLFLSEHDAAAMEALVKRHGPMVWGVCLRIVGNHHDAEDAFQATFLVLLRKAATISPRSKLAAWLYGVARQTALNARKTAAKRERREREVAEMSGPEEEQQEAWRDLEPYLDNELSRLPEAYRIVLVLCDLEGKTRKDAAKQLGLPEGTVAGRLARARALLAKRLGRHGLALSAATLAPMLASQAASAAVPIQVMAKTTNALTLVAAGQAPSALVPAKVVALMQSVLKSMLMSKLKITAGLLFASAVICGTAIPLGAWTVGIAAFSRENPEQVQNGVGPKLHVAPVLAAAQPEPGGLDGDGRPLPAEAVHRLGSRRFRIEGLNNFALASPDGKRVLVQPSPSISGYQAQGLMLLDADTGLRVRFFEDSRRVPVAALNASPASFSPDWKTLYAVADDKLEANRDRSHHARETDAFDRTILVWDVPTGKLKAEFPLPAASSRGASMFAVYVTPDGKKLLVSGSIGAKKSENDRKQIGVPGLYVLDASTGKHLATWENAGNPAGITSGGGGVITCERNLQITAWDMETGKPLKKFPLAGSDLCAAVSPDGTIVAGACTVGETGKNAKRILQVRLWEASTGREIRQLVPDEIDVNSRPAQVVFAQDGKTLYMGTFAGRILRWDLSNGMALPGWQAHGDWVTSLLPRPGTAELLSTCWYDMTLRRWDSTTGKAVSTTDAYVGVLAVAQTPDRKQVAVGDWTGRVDIWEIETGRRARSLQLPADNQRCLIFSPDGKSLLDATENGKITVRDALTGKARREIPPPELQDKNSGGWDLSFNPDGRSFLASKSGFKTRLLSWPECQVIWQSPDRFYAEFSPDGKRMLSASWRGSARFLDAASGSQIAEVQGGDMTSAAFSPNGRLLLTGHFGETIEGKQGFKPWGYNLPAVWRVRDGITGAVLRERKESQIVWCVAFSPTGRMIAVASDNGVRVYETATWQQIARFDGHEGTVGSLFFGADEASLISASSEDGTVLVWSLRPANDREPLDAAQLWAGLAGDGPEIRRTLWAAARQPDMAIKLFRSKWPIPKNRVDASVVARLIGELDSSSYAKREAAAAELIKLGRSAEDSLRKASAEPASIEVKQRVDKLLARWDSPPRAEYPADEALELRAVWALELAATAEARTLLEDWAAAKVGNRLCEEAAAAVKRMERKGAGR